MNLKIVRREDKAVVPIRTSAESMTSNIPGDKQDFDCEFAPPMHSYANEHVELVGYVAGNDTQISRGLKTPVTSSQQSILRKPGKKIICHLRNKNCVRWHPDIHDKPKECTPWTIISTLGHIIAPIVVFVCVEYLLFC